MRYLLKSISRRLLVLHAVNSAKQPDTAVSEPIKYDVVSKILTYFYDLLLILLICYFHVFRKVFADLFLVVTYCYYICTINQNINVLMSTNCFSSLNQLHIIDANQLLQQFNNKYLYIMKTQAIKSTSLPFRNAILLCAVKVKTLSEDIIKEFAIENNATYSDIYETVETLVAEGTLVKHINKYAFTYTLNEDAGFIRLSALQNFPEIYLNDSMIGCITYILDDEGNITPDSNDIINTLSNYIASRIEFNSMLKRIGSGTTID